MAQTVSIRNPQFKAGISAFALTLFLFVQLLSWSAALHHAFHDDAEEEEHQCAVTLLQNGQIDAPEPVVQIVRLDPVSIASVLPEISFCASPAHLTPFGRGPPALA